MPESFSIFESPTSNVSQLYYEATLTTADGQPVIGEDVWFRLEGDGSFSPAMSNKEQARETDAAGHARMIWYRRSIYGRNVKATVSVAPPRDGLILKLEQITAEEMQMTPRTSWTPQRKLY